MKLASGPARHVMLFGGSRSAKTFTLCYATLVRAMHFAQSTHAIFREHFNHLKHSIIYDTMPKVARICFPFLEMHLDKSDWFHELPNGARLVYGGLDDNERTEKILGQEHSTLLLNEVSQISYGARNKAVTRLAQNSGLRLKAYYDCNPPPKTHWSYRLFIRKIEPTSGKPLDNPDNYVSLKMNPVDNIANLPKEVLEELNALPPKDRARFLNGLFADAVENALWDLDAIQRVPEINDSNREQFLTRLNRVVIAVDPSGCEGPEDKRSDQIGLIAVGLEGSKEHGIGYLLDDRSGHYSPEGWGLEAYRMFELWKADLVIGEANYGGDMVRAVVQAVNRNIPFKKIRASRGKHVRADPVSALYAKNRIKHCGYFPDLEDQMCNMSQAGYNGERSPDRLDASVFGFTELMLDTTKGQVRTLF